MRIVTTTQTLRARPVNNWDNSISDSGVVVVVVVRWCDGSRVSGVVVTTLLSSSHLLSCDKQFSSYAVRRRRCRGYRHLLDYGANSKGGRR